MNVPMLDLKAQYATIRREIDEAIAEVFASQYFIMGPKVTECEEKIAEYCDCRYGIGVSSGTDALIACLMAEDIGRDDEVITTPYSFFATAGSIARLGARPVFVDVDPVTYNIRPELIEEKITGRTRAIIPVHLFGQMAPMEPIMALSDRHGLTVIEDAAQAIGAADGGRKAGSVGHYGCLSFFPSKNLGGAGDGGMVVTNDPERAEKVRILRDHGQNPRYYHGVIGGNFRLDALQAAVVTVKLKHLDGWTRGRQSNAKRYGELFQAAAAAGRVTLPGVVTERHIFHQYVMRVPRRDAVQAFLRDSGVGCAVYYPVPLHLQECFSYLGHMRGDLPASEQAAHETLTLPIYPELSDEQAGYVVECLMEGLGAA